VIVSGLPTLGGWEAIQKMREIRPSLKTLIASAFVPPNLEIEIAQAALDGVIAKPYQLNEILEKTLANDQASVG